MSGINMSYEIASDGGGMQHYKGPSLMLTSKPESAYAIAGEIINEILENALDIATRASDTGISWKDIKESESSTKLSINAPLSNVPDLKYSKHNLDMDKVCRNIVGDLVDQMGMTLSPNISEVINELNSIKADEDLQQGKPDAEPLTVEMKKLLSEMLSPPYQIINYDAVSVKGGVGDQASNAIIAGMELIEEPETPKAVEKKSRVTDLVKNSPQLISEYLMMDEQAKQNQEEWEESEEKLLQVIELDYVKPGEEAFRMQKENKIALPEDDDIDIFQIPEDDGIMDVIDLSSNAFREEERQLSISTGNDNGAKGDECVINNTTVEMPQSTASSGGEAVEYPEEKSSDGISEVTNDKQLEKIKKKKWNLGTKIWSFFKKGHKAQGRGSSTSTAKPL